jgi:signal transduction histidine kinase
LTRLADVTAGDELNAIALGETAVESLIATRPGSAAAAAIAGEKGPVIVARHGHEPPDPHLANIPLRIGGRDVGWVIISAPTPFTDDELEDFEASLQPLALAFANVKLLQTIVGRAISHERSRIARELHDELGPSLASLGLALDLAMVEHPAEPGLAGRLTELRSNVAELVNDVRLTVSDLRALPSDSLVTALRQEALRAGNGPELRIDIDERRPPRPSMAAEVRAILSEAVRNAVRHADATTVSIAGFVDFDRGRLTVRDDGHGFDVDGISRGHFGLVGMQERAVQIGASLTVESTTTGTEVKIEWEIP